MLTLGICRTCIILENRFEAVSAIAILQSCVPRGPKRFENKNGQTWRACHCPKWSIGNIPGYLGQFWAYLHSFGSFWTQINILPQEHKLPIVQSALEQKIKFFSEMVQKSPYGPKMVPNAPKNKNMLHSSFRTIWTTFGYWQVFHVWPFLIRKGPFWTPPCTWLKNGNGCPGQLKRAERG